jgi:hypothetical protein
VSARSGEYELRSSMKPRAGAGCFSTAEGSEGWGRRRSVERRTLIAALKCGWVRVRSNEKEGTWERLITRYLKDGYQVGP